MDYIETKEILNIIIEENNKENDIRGYKFKDCGETIFTEKIEITNCIFENYQNY